jgi:WD40 repeat protein
MRRLLCLLAVALAPAAARAQQPNDALPPGAVARLGSVRFHHPTGIVAAAFSPDGKTLAVVGNAPKGLEFCFWDTATGKELARFTAEDRYINSLVFAPDGKHILFSGSPDGIYLYEWATGKLVRQITTDAQIYCCALSPDGTLVVAQPMANHLDAPILVWDLATGKELEPFPGRGNSARSLRFSADGKRLLSWTTLPTIDKTGYSIGQNNPRYLCVWDVATRKKLHEHKIGPGEVALAGDGQTAAMVVGIGVQLVDIPSGKTTDVSTVAPVFFAFTPDNKALVTAGYGDRPILWDAATGKEIRRFVELASSEWRLAGFAADGKTLAVMTGRWNEDGSILLLDVASGKALRQGDGHTDTVTCVAFAPNGKRLASGGVDRTVRLWDVATTKELACLKGHAAPVWAVAYSPDGKLLATAAADGKAILWTADGKEVAKLDGTVEGGASVLAFSADGKTLTAGGKVGTLRTWEVPTGKSVRWLDTGPHSMIMALHPGGPALSASGNQKNLESNTERLQLWDLAAGKAVLELKLRPNREPHEHDSDVVWSGALSAHGRFAAAGTSRATLLERGMIYGQHKVRLFERMSGQEVALVKDVRAHALAFAPQARLLAVGHGNNYGWRNGKPDHDVSLWDVLGGEQRAHFKGHTNQVACVAFSPDGTLLVSGSADHTLLIWKVPAAKPAAAATADQLQRWWDDLDNHINLAYPALAGFVDHPAEAVKWLAGRLKPAPVVDSKRIAELIRLLDSENFKERQKANAELEDYGDLAEGALRKKLQEKLSLEMKRRVELLLAKVEVVPPAPAQLRLWRAVLALELMGTEEARSLLESLAKGAPEARQTREAAAALERLRAIISPR